MNVFSRAGLPTELLRADFISEKVAGIDVTRTLQPRFGAAAAGTEFNGKCYVLNAGERTRDGA